MGFGQPFHRDTVLGKFLKNHCDKAEPLANSAGGAIGLYVLLAEPWTFATLAAGTAIFGRAIGGLKKLQEIAETGLDGKGNREKHAILLSLASREAYLTAATGEIPRTLQAFDQKPLGVFGDQVTISDIGPELVELRPDSLEALASPIFDFLEKRLEPLLVRAEVPTSERERCCKEIRRKAAEELQLIVAGDDKRFGFVRNYQSVVMLDHYLADAAQRRNTAVRSPEEPGMVSLPEVRSRDESPMVSSQAAPPRSMSLATAVETAPFLPEALRNAYEKRFELAKKELEKGSAVRAAQAFGEIADEAQALGDPSLAMLRARCLHNRGIALLNSGRQLEAIKAFEETISLPVGTVRTKMGRFFVPFCQEHYPIALQRIRELIAEHPEETAFRIHEADCLARMQQVHEALALLDAQPENTESYHTLRSQLLSRRERFAEAEAAAQAGLKVVPDSEQLKLAGLFARMKPVFDRLHRERKTRRHLAEPDRTALHNAKREYLEIVACTERDGLPPLEAESLAMVGNILVYLQQPGEAVSYFERSLALVPDNENVWGNYHSALVQAEQYDKAFAVAEKAADVIGMPESLGRQAGTWLQRNEPEKALELLASAFTQDATLKADPTLHVVWLQCLGMARRPETKAETLAYVAESGRNSRELISAAEIMEAIGDREEATKLVTRAEEAANLDLDDALLVRTVAGRMYYRRDQWGEAIKRLGADGLDPTESEHVLEIIVCLINLNDLPGAVALAERVIAAGRGSPEVDRALAHCYLRIGKEAAAEPLVRKMVAAGGSYRDRLTLFQIVQRLKQPRMALPILEEAVAAYPKEFEGHLILSMVYYALKQYALSLKAARRAYELQPDHPAVRRCFIQFVPNTFPGELLNDVDKAVIRQAMGDRDVFTPVELKEKDGELDITPLLAQLRARREHVTQVMEHYRQKHFPLCFIGELIGESTFGMWWELTRGTNERLFVTRGDAKAQETEAHECRREAVVLDPTALFTLAELKLLDLPFKCFKTVLVDGQSLVQLKQTQMQLAVQSESQTVAHYHEGRLLLTESDPGRQREKIELLNSILEMLHNDSRVKVQGPNPQTWQEFEQDSKTQQVADHLPDGSLAPALLAKSEGASYYCDDEGLRGLVGNEMKVSGFATQTLLQRALHEGVIDGKAYHAALGRLLERNYYFVSVDRQFIRWTLQERKLQRDRVGDRLVSEMGTTTFGHWGGATELGAMAGYLWLNTYFEGKPSRNDWLPAIAKAVAELPGKEVACASFLMGTLVELIWLPEAFIGLTEWLIHEGGLPENMTEGLRVARSLLAAHICKAETMEDFYVARRWSRAFKAAQDARRMLNRPQL